MLAEYYPGWNMNALVGLFDKAGVRIKSTDLNGSHGAMNGGRCHWQVAAFYFSSPEEFHVVWDRTIPYDEDFTVSYQYEMDCKQRGAPLEKYKGPGLAPARLEAENLSQRQLPMVSHRADLSE